MASQTVDDVIMCVVGMGFDFDDCQEAIQKGKMTPEAIVEWILAGKPTADPGSVGPPPAAASMLRLGAPTQQQQGASGASNIIGSNPFLNPQSVSSAGVIAMETESTESEKDDDNVKSRLLVSDEQRIVKERFEEKQRLEVQKQVREEKLAKKKAKEEVLARLKEDREERARRTQGHSPQKPGSTSGTSSAASSSPVKPTSDTAMIQVRLPNGRVLRQQFKRSSLLQEVWSLVKKESADVDGLCLVQPFPRVEYGSEQMAKTLEELSLVPSGSLVVNKPQNKEQTVSETVSMETEQQQTQPQAPQQQDPSVGIAAGGSAPPIDVDSEGENEDSSSDGEDMVGGGGGFPGMGGVLGGGGAGRGMVFPGMGGGGGFGRGAGMGRGAHMPGFGQGMHDHNWGSGQSLTGQVLNPENLPHQRQDPKQLAAEAARMRYGRKPAESNRDTAMETSTLPAAEIPSLSNMLIQYLCTRICDARNPLLSLQGVPSDLAIKVIDYLIKNRLLKPKTLKPFISCHLRKLVLDCYPYVTNELLAAIRVHTYILHLSLCSCPLITDRGLQPLTALTRLKLLNLSGCQQLTNQCFTVIKEFRDLVTLILEDTGVTDDGVCTYAQTAPPQLHTLDLSRTAVTHTILQALPAITQLKVLNLEHTQVASLSGVQQLVSLEGLNVANTPIVTDSLLCLQVHPSLVALNISNTNNVNGDLALQYIAGLKLQILNLPSRLTTSDVGMKYLVDMPLHTLDLTNYISVGDVGMEHICKIHTLKKLRLGNTKLTDGGMIFLAGLHNLEELILDRTTITDVGAEILGGLTRLQELSLSETGVTNVVLQSGVLHSCIMLSKLNISKTHVSNKGIRCLKLPHLVLLNVDDTRISEPVAGQLEKSENLPQLAKVIYRHLHTPPASDEEMQ